MKLQTPITLTFGEYMPDLPDLNNPGATQATNCVPLGNSYGQFLGGSVYSDALDARCQGAYSTRQSDATTYNFAGNASKLYNMSSAAWSDISVSGGYSTASEERWEFTTFGDRVIATNFADDIQSYVMGTSSLFANLSATAPKARHIASARNFVMVGNTWDSTDGNVPNRVRWCQLGDPTTWTIDADAQSDQQDLESDYGWVQRIVGGEFFTIFQEKAIQRATYVGSPLVWRFDAVETARGALVPSSVIKMGSNIFFLADDGFFAFDGQNTINISENKITDTFFDDLDFNHKNRMSAALDPDRQIIYWSYPGAGNTNGRPNKILAFNYSQTGNKRWSTIEVDSECLFNSLAEGYTLEQLDSFGTLDTLPFSLDSRVWMGDSILLSGFNSDNKQINFTGTALTATIDTQEGQLFSGKRASVNLLRPLVDGSNATVTVKIGTRNTQTGTRSFSSSYSTNSTGNVAVRENAFYHMARVEISGGFDHAMGIEVLEATPVGVR